MFVVVLYEPFLVKVRAVLLHNCCSMAVERLIVSVLQLVIITIIV